MDLFEKYLSLNDNPYVIQALTDSSAKQLRGKKPENNKEMGTFGDVIIKYFLTKILFDNESETKLSVDKQRYESDRTFVTVIAKRYDLLKYIKCDTRAKKSKRIYNYDYDGTDSHKYIATCVEAFVCAIYLDMTKGNTIGLSLQNQRRLQSLIESWISLVDNAK